MLMVSVQLAQLPGTTVEGHGVHRIEVDTIFGPSSGFSMSLQRPDYSKLSYAQAIQKRSKLAPASQTSSWVIAMVKTPSPSNQRLSHCPRQ
jgi:hypothetical protein